MLSAAQFWVVKWTKHFGQHFLSFVGAYAVLYKALEQDDAMRRLGMRDFNDPPNISDHYRARQSSTEQHRAAPSSTEQHRAASNKTQQVVKRIQHFTE